MKSWRNKRSSRFPNHPRKLLVHHSFSNSEMLGVLCGGIVVKVEDQMLLQFSLSRNL
jgi:hypothetical protein